MADRPDILIVGSINMDLVVRSPHMPGPGETILGKGFSTSPGGKGANQAVAAARLGANVSMVGRVGDDAFGGELVENMKAEGIDCEHVRVTENTPTGVAVIVVDGNGENSIVVASGANYRLTPDDIFPRSELFDRADVVLLQLELPLPTVRAAAGLARRHGCKIVLDPAPAPACMPDDLCEVDVLSPNVSEAELITGSKTGEERADRNIGLDLVARGAKSVVLKLGSRGSLVVTSEGQFARVGAYKVDIVDTTAAGDAFTAALAVAIAEGTSLPEAARFANAAGALACASLGAQTAMPTAIDVKMLMEDQPT